MEKEEKVTFLVQREGRVTIPRGMRQGLGIQVGDYVTLSIRKATDKEILEALKRR